MTTQYHVKTLVKPCLDGDTETVTGHLAKAIFDIVTAANTTITNVAITAQTNRYVTAVVVYGVTS